MDVDLDEELAELENIIITISANDV